MSTNRTHEQSCVYAIRTFDVEQAIGHMLQHLLHIETTCPGFLDPERSRRSRRAGPWEELPLPEGDEGDEQESAAPDEGGDEG